MLPKRQRVPTREFPKGAPVKSVRADAFVVKQYASRAISPRFAVIIGKNTDKRSSYRHVLKRRAMVVLRQASLPPGDFVILVLPAANKLEPAEFRRELNLVLKKLESRN